MAHHDSHAYSYATALFTGKWSDSNLASLRAKCARYGHTEGELQLVESAPRAFIRGGFPAIVALRQQARGAA